MAGAGLLIIIIGFLCALFGFGGTAKLNLGKFGVLSASSGIVLMVLGALLLAAGI